MQRSRCIVCSRASVNQGLHATETVSWKFPYFQIHLSMTLRQIPIISGMTVDSENGP